MKNVYNYLIESILFYSDKEVQGINKDNKLLYKDILDYLNNLVKTNITTHDKSIHRSRLYEFLKCFYEITDGGILSKMIMNKFSDDSLIYVEPILDKVKKAIVMDILIINNRRIIEIPVMEETLTYSRFEKYSSEILNELLDKKIPLIEPFLNADDLTNKIGDQIIPKKCWDLWYRVFGLGNRKLPEFIKEYLFIALLVKNVDLFCNTKAYKTHSIDKKTREMLHKYNLSLQPKKLQDNSKLDYAFFYNFYYYVKIALEKYKKKGVENINGELHFGIVEKYLFHTESDMISTYFGKYCIRENEHPINEKIDDVSFLEITSQLDELISNISDWAFIRAKEENWTLEKWIEYYAKNAIEVYVKNDQVNEIANKLAREIQIDEKNKEIQTREKRLIMDSIECTSGNESMMALFVDGLFQYSSINAMSLPNTIDLVGWLSDEFREGNISENVYVIIKWGIMMIADSFSSKAMLLIGDWIKKKELPDNKVICSDDLEDFYYDIFDLIVNGIRNWR